MQKSMEPKKRIIQLDAPVMQNFLPRINHNVRKRMIFTFMMQQKLFPKLQHLGLWIFDQKKLKKKESDKVFSSQIVQTKNLHYF
jgi:hypothetical protein